MVWKKYPKLLLPKKPAYCLFTINFLSSYLLNAFFLWYWYKNRTIFWYFLSHLFRAEVNHLLFYFFFSIHFFLSIIYPAKSLKEFTNHHSTKSSANKVDIRLQCYVLAVRFLRNFDILGSGLWIERVFFWKLTFIFKKFDIYCIFQINQSYNRVCFIYGNLVENLVTNVKKRYTELVQLQWWDSL